MYPAFLDPYEKIVYLRKKYKITQKQLAGSFYSQAYLTKLETKKQVPTQKNLQYFVNQLNKIFKERNIQEVVCYDDIKKTKKESVDKFLQNVLDTINSPEEVDEKKKSFNRVITDLKLYENHLDHEQKFKLYIEIGEKAFELEEYDTAKTYGFNFIFEAVLLKNIKEMQRGFVLLTNSCIMAEDYNYVLELQSLLEPYFEKFKPQNKEIIYLNLATMYIKQKNYSTALQYLEKIEKEIQIKNHFFEKEVNKAFIYRKLKMFDKAEKIYNSLAKKDKNKDTLLWAKTNLLTLYKEAEDFDSLKKNYYYVKRHIDSSNSENLKKFLYTTARSAAILNKKKDAVNFFNQSLKKNEQDSYEEEDINLNYNCIKELLNLFKKKDLDKVLELQDKYFELTEKKSNPTVAYEFVDYYTKFKCYENLKNFINKQKYLSIQNTI